MIRLRDFFYYFIDPYWKNVVGHLHIDDNTTKGFQGLVQERVARRKRELNYQSWGLQTTALPTDSQPSQALEYKWLFHISVDMSFLSPEHFLHWPRSEYIR